VLYIENSSNKFRRRRRRKQAPVICGSPANGLAAFFKNCQRTGKISARTTFCKRKFL